ALGYDYGPMFQSVHAVWRAGDDVYAEVALPGDGDGAGWGIHPALFDAAMHGGLLQQGPDVSAVLPVSGAGVRPGATRPSRGRARIRPLAGTSLSVDLTTEDGAPVLSMDRLDMRPVEPGRLTDANRTAQNSLLRLGWEPVTAEVRPVRLAVLGDLAAEGQRHA